MKIICEDSIRHFEFWAGAVDTAAALTEEQMDEVEQLLEELFPEGIEDGTLNDLFWFDEDSIAEWLGFESFEALEAYNEKQNA